MKKQISNLINSILITTTALSFININNAEALVLTNKECYETGDPVFNEVVLPEGESSFADKVVEYKPGTAKNASWKNSPYRDPKEVIGIADVPKSVYENTGTQWRDGGVSLGKGGSIVVKFTNNALVGSGDKCPDLWVYEIGKNVESSEILISKDGVNWKSVGFIEGSTSSVDIDKFGVSRTDKFLFVKIIDNAKEGGHKGFKSGADIDAVAAISSVPLYAD